MSVYRPMYKDKKTGKYKHQKIWWYKFVFAGLPINEPTKSTRKTVAIDAEKKRRLELERGFNGLTKDTRKDRIRTVAEVANGFFEDYKVRHPDSETFAKYALGHLKRILGKVMTIDVVETTITDYQTARLTEKAAPKCINEEVGFLMRLLEEQGDFLRLKLRRKKMLKLRVTKRIAKAYDEEQKAGMLAEARKRRSRGIYAALMLSHHCGLRDKEMKHLTLGDLDLKERIATVGKSKTDAGSGRTIPLNDDVHAAMVEDLEWYLKRFGELRPEWYLFPFGRPQPTDPTRPVTSFKTVWTLVRKNSGVTGRWHDNRHTFVTDLAEGTEASDQTIKDMAGHVADSMLKHYSHIRMLAKRRAVDSLTAKSKAKVAAASGNEQR